MRNQNELTFDLTWRRLRQPLKTRFYRLYLRVCMDRLKLPCDRLEAIERSTRRHYSRGMMVYPVQEREE